MSPVLGSSCEEDPLVGAAEIQQVDLPELEARLEERDEPLVGRIHGGEVLQLPLAELRQPGRLQGEPQAISIRALLIGERGALHPRVDLEGLSPFECGLPNLDALEGGRRGRHDVPHAQSVRLLHVDLPDVQCPPRLGGDGPTLGDETRGLDPELIPQVDTSNSSMRELSDFILTALR